MELSMMELWKREGLGETETKLLVDAMSRENEFRKTFIEIGLIPGPPKSWRVLWQDILNIARAVKQLISHILRGRKAGSG